MTVLNYFTIKFIAFNHSSRIKCKLIPGMEKEQYFKEQYFIGTRNLNFSLQNSCTPHVPNNIRTANVHNQPK